MSEDIHPVFQLRTSMDARYIPPEILKGYCRLDNGRHDFGIQPDSPDLGWLGQFPFELVEIILKHLDIPSLTTFRRVSKRAMHTVDSTFEYKEVVRRAPHIIRCALAVGARRYSLHDVYVTLRQKAEPWCPCGVEKTWICVFRGERVCLCRRTPRAPAASFDKSLALKFFGPPPWYPRPSTTTKITALIRERDSGVTVRAENFRHPEGYGVLPPESLREDMELFEPSLAVESRWRVAW
ncbi:hypothetical protein KVR01_006012 [Diaporthe batatas]|uniref:uncharacterized protein n=1 Tax=Diaporthe batatas TaxID=748121 RepID=UPI001D04936E|nr:uncharacterized protein KVR01_006012 [Diaporthe batatas]KAG8164094.1 hypothetical protein KVR01_006012 [Diaporthe batatas]